MNSDYDRQLALRNRFRAIHEAQQKLSAAREEGDRLKIDLAEDALNDLLDRRVTEVTRNEEPT